MPVTDPQLEMIFRYFDGELTDEEEQQLLQQLPGNLELQQAFDQQVLLHRFVAEKEEMQPAGIIPELESARDFLQRVTGGKVTDTATAPIVRMPTRRNRWRLPAAAAVSVGLLTGGYFYWQSVHRNPSGMVLQKPVRDTATLVQHPGLPAPPPEDTLPRQQPVSTDILYADNHTLFPPSDEVPPQATLFSNQYDQRQFPGLAAASEKSLELKGQGDPEEAAAVLAYFNFYKALANLETGKASVAIILLQKVLESGDAGSLLRPHARWYLLLAYLKKGERQKAITVTGSITREKSDPYYKKALRVKEALRQ